MGVNYVGPHISLHSGIELAVYKSARETIESTCGEGPSPRLMCKGVQNLHFYWLVHVILKCMSTFNCIAFYEVVTLNRIHVYFSVIFIVFYSGNAVHLVVLGIHCTFLCAELKGKDY